MLDLINEVLISFLRLTKYDFFLKVNILKIHVRAQHNWLLM